MKNRLWRDSKACVCHWGENMSKTVKRGYVPNDEKEFYGASVPKLYEAAKDLQYLLDRGYRIKGASVFIGNHYIFSERQRLALVRGVSSFAHTKVRKQKEVTGSLTGKTVHIDGLNSIITTEVALSDTVLLKGMDGSIRDLAALRGSYRVIDKTEQAVRLIGEYLIQKQAEKAVFYLDAPVSNSGRLKGHILEWLSDVPFCVEVEVIHAVDRTLEVLDCVMTGDAIILDKCKSWVNANAWILEKLGKSPTLDFTFLYPEESEA